MPSISVGIREAKIKLSQLLKTVQKGREIIITDRDKPVAKIVPLDQSSLTLAQRVRELERDGWIEPCKKEIVLHPSLPLPDEAAQKILDDERK